MPCPSYSPWFDRLNIWRRAQIMNFLAYVISPSSCCFLSYRSKYILSIVFSDTFNLCSHLRLRDEDSHPCEKHIYIVTDLFSLLSLFWKNKSRLMRSPCCLCLLVPSPIFGRRLTKSPYCLCLCVFPLIFSFPMRPASCQRKVGN
jgi:hypothetical protein